jgi:hypothetical protein
MHKSNWREHFLSKSLRGVVREMEEKEFCKKKKKKKQCVRISSG